MYSVFIIGRLQLAVYKINVMKTVRIYQNKNICRPENLNNKLKGIKNLSGAEEGYIIGLQGIHHMKEVIIAWEIIQI